MFKTKRKRAVVLALIAFFCTAAATYVAVDWKRFGGGVLAFFKGGKNDVVVGSTGGASGSAPIRLAAGGNQNSSAPLTVAAGTHKHISGAGGGAGGHKSDDDLFKYGDPAAGGIPPGSFIVAQNDAPPVANVGGTGAPAPAGTPEAGGEGGGGDGGVTSSAPGPTGGGALLGSGPTTSTPAAPTPSGPSDPGGGLGATPPPAPLPPVSAVPEASSLAMMSLGALFVAAAATRRRRAR
jgi:hypothetical protein